MDILAHKPGAVAAIVIVAGRRLTLIGDDKVYQGAVFAELDDTARRFGAKFYSCHNASCFYSQGGVSGLRYPACCAKARCFLRAMQRSCFARLASLWARVELSLR